MYKVSNMGRVKSLCMYNNRYGKYCYRERILKPAPNNIKHYNVVLSKNKEEKHFYVHRLVAQAFIPNPNNLPIVNHKDENPANNNVENLEWCDIQYNNTYGTFIQRRVKNTDYSKLKNYEKCQKEVIQMDLNNKIIRIYKSLTEASKATGSQVSKISSCCTGKRRTTNGYKWEFKEREVT